MRVIETHTLNSKIISDVMCSFETILDYLVKYHVGGFYVAADVILNNKPVNYMDFDKKIYGDDIVVIVHRPSIVAPIAGSMILTYLANMAISAAVSYAMAKLFAPEMPDDFSTSKIGNAGRGSSVYSLNSNQNEAKIGEIIPIIYGRIRTFPALITPPYRRYENNDEYLYQLMCIGQGQYDIQDVNIGDTRIDKLRVGDFQSTFLEYDDFSILGGLKAAVNDANYAQLVKTSPDVDKLELRGTPANKNFVMSFTGSTITFYDYSNGTRPDLTSLVNGSSLTISGTVSNDGVYLVDFVTDNVVTVQSHTFTTEPTDSVDLGLFEGLTTDRIFQTKFDDEDYYFFRTRETRPNGNYQYRAIAQEEAYFTLTGTVYSDGLTFQALSESNTYKTFITDNPTEEDVDSNNNTHTVYVNYVAKVYQAEFETVYGTYMVEGYFTNEMEDIEIDYVLPNGLYNSDASGNLTDRTVEYEVTITNLKYPLFGAPPFKYIIYEEIISVTDKTSSAIRKTWTWSIVNNLSELGFGGRLYVTFRRITPEPNNVNKMDKIFIQRLKAKYFEPDNSIFGNITLMWAKIKATDAITSIGQFSINTWVKRNDVLDDVSSVITDIYTNTEYGGRLSASDLDLPTTTEVINGAFDNKLTVMDAMSLAAKSNRYSVNLVGGSIELKRDEVTSVHSAFFNETNIIRDTLKISYNFTENNEYDSVKIKYRDAEDFKDTEALYPSAGVFPETIELWGCTDAALALATATYMYKQDRSRRKTVEFVTDLQGLLPQFMDKIAVSHNVPNWGLASEVIAVNGSIVTIADNVTAGYDTIIFRNDDGSVSDILSFVADGSNLTVTSLPAWVHSVNEYEATKCSIGTSTELVQDFLVTSVKPSGNNFKIEGVNYDAAVYT